MPDNKPLPHLQFAILGILMNGPQSGREIRDGLGKLGIEKAGPAFYRLMGRLEESGMAKGWYTQEIVDGQIFRERVYEASAAGRRAWSRTRDFHMTVIGLEGRAGDAAKA